MAVSLNIGTLNVRGLRGKVKRRALFEFLKHTYLDLIFLQETHSSISDEKYWEKEWGAPI